MKIENLEKKIEENNSKVNTLDDNIKGLEKEYQLLEEDIREVMLKDKLGDLYSDEREILKENMDSIIELIKPMEDDERLLMGYFLEKKGGISFCGRFGSYKNPTTCESCHEGELNIEKLELKKYVKFEGSRRYRIPEEKVKQVLTDLAGDKFKKENESLKDKITKTGEEIVNLKERIDEESKLVKIYKHLEEEDINYEAVQESMPELIKSMKQILDRDQELRGVDIDLENKIAAFVTKERAYLGGSSGISVDSVVYILKDGKEIKTEHYNYRDSHSFSGNRPELNFYGVEILNYKANSFKIRLEHIHPDDYNDKFIDFELVNDSNGSLDNMVSEEEKKEFQKGIRKKVEELIDKHYEKDRTMPASLLFRGYGGQVSNERLDAEGINEDGRVPFKSPTLIDSCTSKDKLEAVIILKAPIDYRVGEGIEYAFLAYKITPEENVLIDKETMYEFEFDEGKTRSLKAKKLL